MNNLINMFINIKNISFIQNFNYLDVMGESLDLNPYNNIIYTPFMTMCLYMIYYSMNKLKLFPNPNIFYDYANIEKFKIVYYLFFFIMVQIIPKLTFLNKFFSINIELSYALLNSFLYYKSKDNLTLKIFFHEITTIVLCCIAILSNKILYKECGYYIIKTTIMSNFLKNLYLSYRKHPKLKYIFGILFALGWIYYRIIEYGYLVFEYVKWSRFNYILFSQEEKINCYISSLFLIILYILCVLWTYDIFKNIKKKLS